MIDHSNCDHPRTSKDRAACRKAKGAGKVHTSGRLSTRPSAEQVVSPYKSFADANEQLAADMTTVDDRIRASRRRPPASAVKVTKVDPASLRCD